MTEKICIGKTGEYADHSWYVNPEIDGPLRDHFLCSECGITAISETHTWLWGHWMDGCCNPHDVRQKADLAHKANNYEDS